MMSTETNKAITRQLVDAINLILFLASVRRFEAIVYRYCQ